MSILVDATLTKISAPVRAYMPRCSSKIFNAHFTQLKNIVVCAFSPQWNSSRFSRPSLRVRSISFIHKSW